MWNGWGTMRTVTEEKQGHDQNAARMRQTQNFSGNVHNCVVLIRENREDVAGYLSGTYP